MTLQAIIEHYGYYAVFAGAFLEGETVLILAGFAAARGYLELPAVMLVAFAASMLGDVLYFFVGRWNGPRLLARFPVLQRRAATVERLLNRYHAPVILVLRFLYGLRTVGPMVIGMSRLAAARFIGFNMVGAALWAVLIGGLGFVFGNTLELLLADLHRYEGLALAGIALAGFLVWLGYRLRGK